MAATGAFLLKVWKDSVWSKVIASAIIGVAAVGYGWWSVHVQGVGAPGGAAPAASAPVGPGGVNVHTGNAGRDINVTVQAPPPGPQTVILYSHAQFWEAITRGDRAAVERLVKDGMTLKPEYLQTYFRSHFEPGTHAVLHAARALPAAGCPVDARGLEFYAASGLDPAKAAAVRDVCGVPAVTTALRETARQARRQIDSATASGAAHAARLEACITKMQRTSPDAWLQKASSFNLLGPLTYAPEQEVLAELNIALATGRITVRNAPAAVRAAIEKTCRRVETPPKPDTKTLAAAEAALAMLAGR
jgi:hypothetical protein